MVVFGELNCDSKGCVKWSEMGQLSGYFCSPSLKVRGDC